MSIPLNNSNRNCDSIFLRELPNKDETIDSNLHRSKDDASLNTKYGNYIKIYNQYYYDTHQNQNQKNKTKKHSVTISNDWNNKSRNKKINKTQEKISRHNEKVLVFDLDETLGSFSELQWIWTTIMEHYSDNPTYHHQNKNITPIYVLQILLEIYPEFLRPGIIHILDYVARRKKQGDCMGIFLYTNNQGTSVWLDTIVEYFNQELKKKNNFPAFFDQVIQSFKIGTQKVELNRTTQMKTYNDLIRCTLLPNETEICFVDNSNYQYMKHPKVFYIQPRSYYHMMSKKDIQERFTFAETSGILNDFYPFLSKDSHHTMKLPFFHSFRFITASSNSHIKPTTTNNNNTNTQMKKFIEKTMHEYELVRGENKKHLPADEMLESIDIDIFVSDKMMRFIREFFIMTTYHSIENPQPQTNHTNKKEPIHPTQPIINQNFFSDGFTGIYYCT